MIAPPGKFRIPRVTLGRGRSRRCAFRIFAIQPANERRQRMKKIITGPIGHPTTRSLLRSVRRQGVALAALATGLTFVLGTSASAVSTTPVPGPSLHTGVGSHIETSGSRYGGVQSSASGVANAG